MPTSTRYVCMRVCMYRPFRWGQLPTTDFLFASPTRQCIAVLPKRNGRYVDLMRVCRVRVSVSSTERGQKCVSQATNHTSHTLLHTAHPMSTGWPYVQQWSLEERVGSSLHCGPSTTALHLCGCARESICVSHTHAHTHDTIQTQCVRV